MSGVDIEQYMRLLSRIYEVLKGQGDKVMSPELLYLSLMAWSAITREPNKLCGSLGLSKPLDFTKLIANWARVSPKTLRFAGFILGATDHSIVPVSLRDSVMVGTMSQDNLTKALEHVKDLIPEAPKINLGSSMVMFYAVNFCGSWLVEAKPSTMKFDGKEDVPGFIMNQKEYPYNHDDTGEYVAMPLEDGTFVVYVMPNGGCSIQGILKRVVQYSEWNTLDCRVRAPDLKLTTTLDLAGIFNVKGMVTTTGLVSQWQMTSSIDVDFRGVRASGSVLGSTAKGMIRTVEINRPYCLYVVDLTRKVTFYATHGSVDDLLTSDNTMAHFGSELPPITLFADAALNKALEKRVNDHLNAEADAKHDFGDTCDWKIDVFVTWGKDREDKHPQPLSPIDVSEKERVYELGEGVCWVSLKHLEDKRIEFWVSHTQADGDENETEMYLYPYEEDQIPYTCVSSDILELKDTAGDTKLTISFRAPGTSGPDDGGPASRELCNVVLASTATSSELEPVPKKPRLTSHDELGLMWTKDDDEFLKAVDESTVPKEPERKPICTFLHGGH